LLEGLIKAFYEDWPRTWQTLKSASFGYFSCAHWFWWLEGPVQELKVNKEKGLTEGGFHRTSNKPRITAAQLKKFVLDNRTEVCLHTRVEPLPSQGQACPRENGGLQ